MDGGMASTVTWMASTITLTLQSRRQGNVYTLALDSDVWSRKVPSQATHPSSWASPDNALNTTTATSSNDVLAECARWTLPSYLPINYRSCIMYSSYSSSISSWRHRHRSGSLTRPRQFRRTASRQEDCLYVLNKSRRSRTGLEQKRECSCNRYFSNSHSIWKDVLPW